MGRRDDRYLDLSSEEMFQTFAVNAKPPLTIRLPSGLKLTLRTDGCPSSVRSVSWPVAASQTLISPPSRPPTPLTIRLPSGLKLTLATGPECPVSVSVSWPVAASQTLISPGLLYTEKTEKTEEYRGVQRSTEAIEVGGGEFFGELPWDNNIKRDVLDTLPTRSGMRNNNVFELARTLKAIPTLTDAPGKHLRPYVRFWHEQALPVIGTKAFEETWIDFLKGWSRVKFPKGSGPMSGILSRALEAELPKEAIVYEQEPLQVLVSLCRELQRVHGDSPFFLSCRKAGQLLHVPFKTANRWLFLLVQDGVLDLVIQGSMSGQQASRFRYTGAT